MTKQLNDVPFTQIRIGQVIYYRGIDQYCVVTTLLAAFSDRGTPDEHELDIITENPELDIEHNFLHSETNILEVIDRVLSANESSSYLQVLAEIRKTHST
jgi:hypothetical protein